MLTIRSRTIATLAALALMLACAAPLVMPAPSHAQTHARAAQTHA